MGVDELMARKVADLAIDTCRDDAEDLTSQVFVDVVEGLADYGERGTFAAWLFTIARRRVVGHCRRSRPALPFDESYFVSSRDSPAQLVERHEQIERLAGLCPSYQVETPQVASAESCLLWYIQAARWIAVPLQTRRPPIVSLAQQEVNL